MNIKTMSGLVFVAVIFFTSCKNETADTELQESLEAPLTELPASELPASETPDLIESNVEESTIQNLEPIQQPVQESANMLQQRIAPAPSQTARMNPAHGQPNHRCDIAVGAPLP